MFEGCNNLTTVSKNSNATLAKTCYRNMFNGCRNLRSILTLSANSLADYCCQGMFLDCVNLITVPEELSAVVAKKECYKDMFNGCSSLSNAPALPATTLEESCY